MDYESQADFWENHLLAAVPEFRAAYDQHLSDYGEILPYLLMTQLLEFVVERWREQRSPPAPNQTTPERKGVDPQVVRRTVDFLERVVLTGENLRIEEIVMVSFLEHINKTLKQGERAEFRALLGPRLTDDLAEVDRFWADKERGVFSPLFGYRLRHTPGWKRPPPQSWS